MVHVLTSDSAVLAAAVSDCPSEPPSLVGLPVNLRPAFAPATEVGSAERFTRELAHSHYENFSVVSFLLPRHLRQDFCNVYAFCRVADDLADEVADPAVSLGLLAAFKEQLRACYAGRCESVLYAALGQTIRRHEIPIDPFLDLIEAFEQDQRVSRYRTFEEVVAYCRQSADPVGRLVLWMCGYRDPQRQNLSDKTCTALQLVNFWQDVRRDLLDRNRIYLPKESMQRFGISEDDLRAQISAGSCDDNFRRLIQFEVDRAASLFDEGEALLPLLDRSVRGQVSLFGKGGRAVIDSIRRQNYDTLSRRPALTKWQKGRLILTALTGRLTGVLRRGPAGAFPSGDRA